MKFKSILLILLLNSLFTSEIKKDKLKDKLIYSRFNNFSMNIFYPPFKIFHNLKKNKIYFKKKYTLGEMIQNDKLIFNFKGFKFAPLHLTCPQLWYQF